VINKLLILMINVSIIWSDNISILNYFPSSQVQKMSLIYMVSNGPISKFSETLLTEKQCVNYHRVYEPIKYSHVLSDGEAYKENDEKTKKTIAYPTYDYKVCWKDRVIVLNGIPILSEKKQWQIIPDDNSSRDKFIATCHINKQFTKKYLGKWRSLIITQCDNDMKDYYVFAEKIGIVEMGNKLGKFELIGFKKD